ncbi:MAG: TIGR00725 family protein [Syntrophobacteraceae bacterium]|nr:TIGR00725 family protein [Syntrophobacteraceae bacterium]
MRAPVIAVIGAGTCSPEVEALAAEIGAEIARSGSTLICGGLGGVMTAAARGAKEAGGVTIGILPGPSTEAANPHIDFAVATNMGQARNAIIVQTADALIAVAGGYGTLSEIALALKIGKQVVALQPQFTVAGVKVVQKPREAVDEALNILSEGRASAPEL